MYLILFLGSRWKFMKRIIFIIVIAAIATPAFADIYTVPSTSTVQYTGVTGGTISIGGTWHTSPPDVYAGSYNLIVDGVSMQSFCIDLQDNSIGTIQTHNVVHLEDAPDPDAGPMGTARAMALAELLYENWTTGMSNADLLSLQVAVWEVVADWDGAYDLTGGSFTATNAGASAYLATIGGGVDYTSYFVGLSNGTYQDYVVRVPLPGAILLGMLGLSIAGIKLRKFA
jgi:hypothetical protein